MAAVQRSTKRSKPVTPPTSVNGPSPAPSTPTTTLGRGKPAAPRQAVMSHEQIARKAYAIWETRGRPHGDDLAHWFAAIAAIRREAGR